MVIYVVAMNSDLVARVPQTHGTTDAQHNAGRIRANDVLVNVVALCPLALFTEASQCTKCADGLENAGPDGVEVDGRRHDRDDHFVGRQFR